MRVLLGVFLFAAALSLILATHCERDSDCRKDECCIEWLPFVKRCSDMPDDPTDRCGGQFLCPCKSGMTCVPDERPGLYGRFKVGTGNCA